MVAVCRPDRQSLPVLFALLLFLCLIPDAAAQSNPRAVVVPPPTTPVGETPPVSEYSDRSIGSSVDSHRSGPWIPSISSMGGNVLDIASAPVRLSRYQKLEVLGTAGLVVGLMSEADGPVNTYIRRDGSNLASTSTGPLAAPGRIYDRIGPDRVAFGAAALLATGGVLSQNRHWTRTSVRLVEAVVYTDLVVGLGKGLVSRTRPAYAGDPMQADIGAFSSAHENLSMPSGHTAQAFAVASVLAHEFDRWAVRVPAYTVAASVGLERIRSGDHWLSDVVVGGTLGYLIGRSVSSSLPQPQHVRYRPILSPDRLGLVVRF